MYLIYTIKIKITPLKNLIFFDKEGNALNFNYNELNERYEGKLIFHENSSDTFKTIGIYMFEKVEAFDFIADSDLILDKFQLFNENGFRFVGSIYNNILFKRIEPVNKDSNFYSKWIIGDDIETKFPVGSEIIFNNSISEFTSSSISYTVVSTKKNGIMILSNTANNTSVTVQNNINATISGFNGIHIQNYKFSNGSSKLSSWSQPDFYSKLYSTRKLNIINTKYNDGIYEVAPASFSDKNTYQYQLLSSNLPSNKKLVIELSLKTDLPDIYDGQLSFDSTTGKITFIGAVPSYLKPGIQFRVMNGSANNNLTLSVAPIQSFSYLISYNQNNIVLFNNRIYKYTGSSPSVINTYDPSTDTTNWSLSDFFYVNEGIVTTGFINSQVYLTTNKIIFEQSWVTSSDLTLANAVSKFATDMKVFNVNLTYDTTNKLLATLKYPSKYVDIKFYHTDTSTSNILTSSTNTLYDYVIPILEIAQNEYCTNISELKNYNITVPDIDEAGLTLTINKKTYYEDNHNDDPVATIASWISFHNSDLSIYGISATQVGNTLTLSTTYPNIELDFDVKVGTTANYYIQHSQIIFNNIGNSLTLTINNHKYTCPSLNDVNFTSLTVANKIQAWVDKFKDILDDRGIYVSASGNTLFINIATQDTHCNYTVNVAKLNTPGTSNYTIVRKFLGNEGGMITSNEVINTNSLSDFKTSDLSTGCLLSILGSIYPFNNTEYNVIELKSDRLTLSYSGPFWSDNNLGNPVSIDPHTENDFDIMYGNLDPNFTQNPFIFLRVREFIRKPKENYLGDKMVKYKWQWVDDTTPEMFIYDFSGNNLETFGPYAYIGPKPLSKVYLNDKPNTKLDKVSLPEYQQTIFDSISYDIDYIDSENIQTEPEPLELFLGFNSKDEGVVTNTLQLMKIENISFDIITTSLNSNIISFSTITEEDGSSYGEITLDNLSTDIFLNKQLKAGQLLKINFTDITNNKGQYVSYNNGKVFKIRSIFSKTLLVDFIDDQLLPETTLIQDYPITGSTTYLSTHFSVIDKNIVKLEVYGQTEIEDIRFKTNLNNIGKNIAPEDVYIFKEYDINEQGVDWTYVNKKRKEMLYTRKEIYDYIGAYKSIINAINYFGYNDLELNEYFKDINPKSKNYGKLIKIEIPDIFDNTVEGWTESDFVKSSFPNVFYEETNLFNLTYNITDNDGNYILLYTLDEILTKLSGLKLWLKKNIIPLTHRIKDITGKASFTTDVNIYHSTGKTVVLCSTDEITPVNFKVEEVYINPINSGSSVYNVVVDFFTIDNSVPDYFTVKIRTYKTYDEWVVFNTYYQGDKVRYFGKLYECVRQELKLSNPRKYDFQPEYSPNEEYNFGDIVIYNRRVYEYIRTEDVALIAQNPYLASYPQVSQSLANWDDITDWKEIDMVPVQTIEEFRSNMLPLNFTLDSNIDPYVIIQVITENGYGENYLVQRDIEVKYDADSKSILKI